jgi:hypothetical protein
MQSNVRYRNRRYEKDKNGKIGDGQNMNGAKLKNEIKFKSGANERWSKVEEK